MGGARREELRAARIVRIGLIQHSIVLPTTSKVREQIDAIHEKIADYIKHAASCGVNVICLQEAWSKKSYIVYSIRLLIKIFFSVPV